MNCSLISGYPVVIHITKRLIELALLPRPEMKYADLVPIVHSVSKDTSPDGEAIPKLYKAVRTTSLFYSKTSINEIIE